MQRERILKTYNSSGEKDNCWSWGIGVGWESVGSARVSEEEGLCRFALAGGRLSIRGRPV